MLRALPGALLAALLALPAPALADHSIAEALRSSGLPLASGSERQSAGGGLLAALRTTPGSLAQVGHSPLLNRGMNAALAVRGDYAYVGSRTDGTHLDAGVLVVDVSHPSSPAVVGQIGPPLEGNVGETSRELRIWPEQDLLIVLNHGCSALIHRCAGGEAAVQSTVRFYDISGANAASPRLVSTFFPSRSRAQIPHEFFLWVDPERPGRALMYYTNPSSSDQELIVTDISGARQGVFTEVEEFKVDLPENGLDNRLHSLGISNDGTRGYLAYLGGGFLVVDTSDFAGEVAQPEVRLITPVGRRVFWGDPGAHSAVKLFGRPFALTTDEVYGKLGGALPAHGCPWGWVRTIDIANERRPRVVGEFRVSPHNLEAYCDEVPADQENLSSQSSHNPTLTHNLALVTWHSRGFQLISIESPRRPRRLAEFMPGPLPAVQTEDPALSTGRDKVVMWSYPIVQDGLIYLVDVRNGLYILRYRGPCQEELDGVGFLEGNSNVGGVGDRSYPGRCAPGGAVPAPPATPRTASAPRPARASPPSRTGASAAASCAGIDAGRLGGVTFRQAEEYLLSLELFGMRFGLDRMHRLMTVLGLPQRRFASIHVVGTNGKSSTVRFCAAILERHGLRTGSYTSPHLGSFRERIEVGEEPVPEADFAAAVARAAQAAELVDRTAEPDDRVTQFEALTAAAYHELARRGVEVAVIEAGLGGRFDATNVIPSKVQVLTSVGLEHTRWLGPTLKDIAEEKLAVVRDHGTLVAGEIGPELRAVAERVAAERQAGLVAPANLSIALRAAGGFQRSNFAIAAAAAESFLGRPLDRALLERAAAETTVPGRVEIVADEPLTVYDGAHNPAGARALAESLDDVLGERRPRIAVIGVLEDKDAAAMLTELLPHADRVVFTRSHNPRALSPATLASLAEKLDGPPAEIVASPRAAVDRARARAGPGGAVLATGSIYLIADLVREQSSVRASSL